MESQKVVINGKYLIKKNPRGVQRYSCEVVKALDKIVPNGVVELVLPHSNVEKPALENIKVVEFGGKVTNKFWQCLAFQLYILKERALAVCLSDGIPYIHPGICAIHDMRFAQEKGKFEGLKRRAGNRFILINSWWIAKFSKAIVTVSNFSKKQICEYYSYPDDKVHVMYNSWQHLQGKEIDTGIFDRHPEIKRKNYFFSLGGAEASKNLKWVLKTAQKNPQDTFVIAGPSNQMFIVDDIDWNSITNVVRVGYITDEEVRALMSECKAFLFPSLFEGFGIPPLEAISVGAKVLVSNAACLPEIYGEYVTCFDPYDYDINLDELLKKDQSDRFKLLEKYSWEKTAQDLWALIQDKRR